MVNGYIWRNSYIHALNPMLKLITFILIVAVIFSPSGFIPFLLLFSFLLFIFFLAKLPKVILKKMIITYIVLFLFLFVLNWISQKTPYGVSLSQLGNYKIVLKNELFEFQNGHAITGKILLGGQNISEIEGNFAKIFSTENDALKYVKEHMEQYSNFNLDDLRYQSLGNNELFAYFSKWYSMNDSSFITAFDVSNRILIVILVSSILSATTSTIELTYALEDLLWPLKLFRFPVRELAMIISIALRFIPSLINESFRIMKAQASRGIDYKNGWFYDKVKVVISLVVPLFTIAFLKADDLANVMSSRGYDPRYARTNYRTFSLHSNDILGFLIIGIIIGFLFYMSFNNFYFAPFKFPEALITIAIR